MYYDNPEEKTRIDIENRRAAAALFPIIREVAGDFDGKVFNCRFENALREHSSRIFVKKRYKWLEITTYGKNYSEIFLLAQINLDDMPDGKRMPAALIIEDARERREKLLREAAETEAALATAPLLKKQLESMKKQLETMMDTIPYAIRENYNLNYYMRNY